MFLNAITELSKGEVYGFFTLESIRTKLVKIDLLGVDWFYAFEQRAHLKIPSEALNIRARISLRPIRSEFCSNWAVVKFFIFW